MQCQVLDSEGNRCRRKATRTVRYFGDPELYSHPYFEKKSGALDGVNWVVLYVCEHHYRMIAK